MKQFRVKEITDRIKRITMPFVCAYLIEGNDRAMLIDTGWGFGDLKSYVDGLTDLPYEVILTHGHADHGGGSRQFDKVYLSSLDVNLEAHSCSMEVRERLISRFVSPKKYPMPIAELLQAQRSEAYHELHGGQHFDLGGLTLQLVFVPGHTQGSMAVIVLEEEIAIFGDACMNGTLLTQPSSTNVTEHLAGLIHLKEFEHLYQRVLVSHRPFEEPKEILDSNIYWAEKILARQDDQVEVNRDSQPYYIARHKDNTFGDYRDYGNIKYSLDKL